MSEHVYRGDDFGVRLPGAWTQLAAGNDTVRFDDAAGAEQLLVQTLRPRAAIGAAEREMVANELFEARAQSLEEVSEERGTMLPARIDQDENAASLAFVGRDPQNDVLIYGRIVVTASRIVIASYYRYASDVPLPDFVRRAQSVCASLDVTPG